MHRRDSTLIFSPTDLCRFVESRFASWMDRFALEHPDRVTLEPPTEETELILRKGRDHEAAYLASLIEDGHSPFDPSGERDRLGATLDAMQRGEPMIRQAALTRDPFIGYADLILRVEGESDLGDYHYRPLDVKLGHSAKPKYILQLCAYIDMLEAVQGRRPDTLSISTASFVTVCSSASRGTRSRTSSGSFGSTGAATSRAPPSRSWSTSASSIAVSRRTGGGRRFSRGFASTTATIATPPRCWRSGCWRGSVSTALGIGVRSRSPATRRTI